MSVSDNEIHTCDSGGFDRTICAEPCGSMHFYCSICHVQQDACVHDRTEAQEPEPGEVLQQQLGRLLRDARLAAGIPLALLAARLDVTAPYVLKIEQGRGGITLAQAEHIAAQIPVELMITTAAEYRARIEAAKREGAREALDAAKVDLDGTPVYAPQAVGVRYSSGRIARHRLRYNP